MVTSGDKQVLFILQSDIKCRQGKSLGLIYIIAEMNCFKNLILWGE